MNRETAFDQIRNFSHKFSNFQYDILSTKIVIGIILIIIGLVILIIELHKIYKIREINNWPKLETGTIVDNYLESSSQAIFFSIIFAANTRNIVNYRNRVAFTYEVAGIKYLGYKNSYFESWDTNPMLAKLEDNLYKPNQKVSVYVNPKNPMEAYLTNKAYNNYTVLAFSIAIFLIGSYILYRGIRNQVVKEYEI